MKLKPCPFCGHAPEVRGTSVVCSNEYCPANGGSLQIPAKIEGGVKWWNRREATGENNEA